MKSRLLSFGFALAAAAGCGLAGWGHRQPEVRAAEGPVTWSRQIAPIVYRNCTACHHPGGAGPFSLLAYADARRWGPQMMQVTQTRFMPPWLPAPGYGGFEDQRRLSDEEMELIRRWVASGMPEGNPAEAPATPHYDATWQMGKPDLILKVERPYSLAASGSDVFRNFVLPYPLAETHFIRAMEILPGQARVVHHANVLIDRTASFRREHPADWKNGVPGMELEVDAGNSFDPDSHFLFWKPDTPVLTEAPGMPWRLDPGNDLILNMHLKPSGKPETITAQIGLYFAKEPAVQHPMLLQLEDDRDLDIPAGDAHFVVQDELKLPLDVEVLGIYPHAHYLGKELDGWAMLPDGQKRWLIRIPNWDIDRQSVYRYRKPVYLPRGSVLHMRYVYDNSAGNVHNPNAPPMRVRAGNRSVDEMAHLWVQVLPVHVAAGSPDPRLVLERAWMEHRLTQVPGDTIALYNLAAADAGLGEFQQAAETYRRVLALDPNDARTLNSLGAALEKAGAAADAEKAFTQAMAADAAGNASGCDARFNLASLELKRGENREAVEEFRELLTRCPKDSAAHSGLGVALAETGDTAGAQQEFQQALAADPREFTALYQLGAAAITAGNAEQARSWLQKAVEVRPGDVDAREHLAMALAESGQGTEAIVQMIEAEKLAPQDPVPPAILSQLLAQSGELQQAIAEQQKALQLQAGDADGWNNLGVLEARAGKTASARSDFEHALQLQPQDTQARANLAQLPPG